LLGYDLSTPEGQAMFKEQKLHVSVCSGLVAEAARIVEGLLS
jgi:hypothetical protein